MNSRVVVRLGVVAAVVALAALAAPVVLRSDWANTAVRTSAAPGKLGLFPLPATVDRKWQAAGLAPRGVPWTGGGAVQSDTVIVALAHRIEGREPETGATRWFYERRNATLCDWTARDGVVFAAFRKAHGCRDLVALNAGTGARTWYRNAELDADITLSAMPSVLVAANAHALVAFDTGGGLNRWTYGRKDGNVGCTLSAPVLGDLGVGVIAGCGSPARQLVLVDAFSGKERFTPVAVGAAARLLSTGPTAAAVLSGGAERPTVTLYGPSGSQVGSVTDPRLRYDDPGRAGAIVHSGLLVGWTGRAVFAVETTSAPLLWVVDGTGPASADAGQVVIGTDSGFAEVAAGSGRVTATFQATHGPAPVTLDRVGAVLVTSGDDGTAVYG